MNRVLGAVHAVAFLLGFSITCPRAADQIGALDGMSPQWDQLRLAQAAPNPQRLKPYSGEVIPDTRAPSAADTSAIIEYAVHSAALSAAISYCHAKHGAVHESSAGGTCFKKARQVLAADDLKTSVRRVQSACPSPRDLQTCITPELGKMVSRLMNSFDAERL